MKYFLLCLAMMVFAGCGASEPTIIQTHVIPIQPAPIVVTDQTTAPMTEATSAIDTGQFGTIPDSIVYNFNTKTGTGQISGTVTTHKRKPPTVSVTAIPKDTSASLTDTTSGKIQNEVVNKPSVGQMLQIIAYVLAGLVLLYGIYKLLAAFKIISM